VLGIAWALLQPVALVSIYTMVFARVARMPSDGKPYSLFAFTALLPWLCFSSSVTTATNGLVSHSHLVTKVYFPRELLPLTYVVAALFDFLIASVLLAGMLLRHGVSLSWNVLYVVPILITLVLFACAMALFLSATQVYFRDIGMAMPLLLQVWMFATPVVYPLSVVPDRLRPLYDLNPLVGITDGFRRAVLGGEAPDLANLGVSATVALVLLALSYAYFKNIEATVADVV
ncbi:MAG: ABC transporter permease, partial [bacterium]